MKNSVVVRSFYLRYQVRNINAVRWSRSLDFLTFSSSTFFSHDIVETLAGVTYSVHDRGAKAD